MKKALFFVCLYSFCTQAMEAPEPEAELTTFFLPENQYEVDQKIEEIDQIKQPFTLICDKNEQELTQWALSFPYKKKKNYKDFPFSSPRKLKNEKRQALMHHLYPLRSLYKCNQCYPDNNHCFNNQQEFTNHFEQNHNGLYFSWACRACGTRGIQNKDKVFNHFNVAQNLITKKYAFKRDSVNFKTLKRMKVIVHKALAYKQLEQGNPICLEPKMSALMVAALEELTDICQE